MKLAKLAAKLIKVAVLQMKVTSASRRGVTIGLGNQVEIPSLVDAVKGGGETTKSIKGYQKNLHWDPTTNTWTYSYISKGLPPKGETIGIGERGAVAYYKVTRSTPHVIELALLHGQKGDFVPKLTFDSETIKKIRQPTWYRQVNLADNKKHQEQLNKVPALKTMFAQAEALAKDAYKRYQEDIPPEARQKVEKPAIERYTESYQEYNNMVGYQAGYKNVLSFLESIDGDERTLTKVRNHVEAELKEIDGHIGTKKEELAKLKAESASTDRRKEAASFRLAKFIRTIANES